MVEAQIITDAFAAWVGRQRWFVGKVASPKLRHIASIMLHRDSLHRESLHRESLHRDSLHRDSLIEVAIILVGERSEAREVIYQVPLVLRRIPKDATEPGFIATITEGDGGEWHLYDGPHDPAFTEQLRRLIARDESAGDSLASARGIAVSEWPTSATHSRVLRGEQSNTSIVYSSDTGDGPSVICKIFRMLHHGDNPDVVLQSALFTAGSTSVPQIYGSVVATWPDESQPGGQAHGHLAFAQRFLAGARDAWGLALAAGSTLADFAASAHDIGIATADIHATLASTMPTHDASRHDIDSTVAAWRARLDAALDEVPELAPLRPSINLLYTRAASVPWPRLQSIHGDLHLGQVLAIPNGTWAIIDFEGEPMRPLAERTLPDLPLRDVAGMLRSFDYAAGSQTPSPDVLEWAHDCRTAFLDGYIAGSGHDVRKDRVLLDAFELDKALYEVVYEAHNRPSWLPIPTNAVRRITDRVEVDLGR
ncbi:MAG: phosphotransferase [Terrimesophilobacter sp.]